MRLRELLVTLTLLAAAGPGLPGQELRDLSTFRGRLLRVDCVLPSPDGKVVAGGGGDTRGGGLKVWEAATGKEIGELPGWTNSLYVLAFTPDGKRLAAGGLGPVQVWDVVDRKPLAGFALHGDHVMTLAFSPDGSRLGVAGWRESGVWDLAARKQVASFRRRIPAWTMNSAAFSPDLATLATPNYEEIELWDVAASKVRALLSEHRGQVNQLRYTDDGKTFLAASFLTVGKDFEYRGEVRLWDLARGRERAVFQDGLGAIGGMALSPDGKVLAVLSSPKAHDEPDVKLLDVGTGRRRVLPARPACSFRSLRFATDGRLLLTGVTAEGVRLWEVTLPKAEGK